MKMNFQQSKLRNNVISQYILQGARYLFPFISLPYLTRVLGPDAYAIRSYVLSVMTFMQTFAEFGFTKYGTKLVIESRNNHQELNQVFSTITIAKLILVILLSIALGPVMYFLPLLSVNTVFTLLSFMAVAINAFLPDFVFQGFEQMSSITKRYVLAKGVSTALLFLFVRDSADLFLIPICDISGNLVAVIWSLYYCAKHYKVAYESVIIADIIRALHSSAKYFTIDFSSTVLNSFSVLVVGRLHVSSSDLSVWSLSLTIINAVQSMYTPITNSLYPNALSSKNYGVVKRIILYSTPVLLIGLISVELFASSIIGLIAGPAYVESEWILRLLAPIVFFSFYGSLLKWPVLGASGHVRELSYGVYLSAAILVVALIAILAIGICNITYVAFVRVFVEAISTCMAIFFCIKYNKELFN